MVGCAAENGKIYGKVMNAVWQRSWRVVGLCRSGIANCMAIFGVGPQEMLPGCVDRETVDGHEQTAQKATQLLARGNVCLQTGRILTQADRIERLSRVLQYEL